MIPLPPPPPPRLKKAPWFSDLDLNGELFIHTDTSEPLHVSKARLSKAIIADGIFDSISPASVWYTYRHHPELHYRHES